MKLVVGSKYQMQYGVVTYLGFFTYPGWSCYLCGKARGRFHEFSLGAPYPNHSELFQLGTECVKKLFVKEAMAKC